METALIKIEEVKALAAKAPELLQLNIESHHKAIGYGQKLLEHIGKEGMTAEADDNIVKFFGNVKATVTAMNDRRKPVTQLVDLLKKQFTLLENDLSIDDKTKQYNHEVLRKLQELRDKYVAEQIETQRKREQEIIEQQNKATEAINILKDCEQHYITVFNNFLLNEKTRINNILNTTTLNTIDTIHETIDKFPDNYELTSHFENIIFQKNYKYHTPEEMAAIRQTFDTKSLFNKFCDIYRNEISLHKLETSDKIQSKKNLLTEEKKRLDDIAAAESAKKKAALEKKLAEDKQKEIDRQAEEAKKLAQEQAALESKAKEESEIKAKGAEAKVVTATQATLFGKAPEAKITYKIEVKDIAGYMEIFAFWFSREAKYMKPDKLGKMTIERMVTYAEKKAEDKEVIKSDYITYVEKINAK